MIFNLNQTKSAYEVISGNLPVEVVVVVVVVVGVLEELVTWIPLRLSYEELNTREKRQRQDGLLTVLQRRNVVINWNSHGFYNTCEGDKTDSNKGEGGTVPLIHVLIDNN